MTNTTRKKYILNIKWMIVIYLLSSINVFAQDKIEINFIYTNDNHGHIEKTESHSGASGLFSLLKSQEKYNPKDSKFVLINGGDFFTGPAISTFFYGRSMVEVFNAFGYDVATIGNHEFDFGLDSLKQRIKELNFPITCANIFCQDDTLKYPDFIRPYAIINVENIKIGVLGVCEKTTPQSTLRENVDGLYFGDYISSLERAKKLLNKENPDFTILITHCNYQEWMKDYAKANNIKLVFNAHYHQKYIKNEDDIYFVQAESYLKHYAIIKAEFNKINKELQINSAEIKANQTQQKDKTIEKIIDKYLNKGVNNLNQIIGKSNKDYFCKDSLLSKIIIQTWLDKFPEYDLAVSNITAVRDDIQKGEISLKKVLGVLPFNNYLTFVKLSGEQIKKLMQNDQEKLIFVGKTEFQDDKLYDIITTNFLASAITELINAPYSKTINVHYRNPFVEFIKNGGLEK